MARGYLGKISAVVTANTAELERRLAQGARSVDSFAKSLQGQVTSASTGAQRALNGIFTPLQKIERALQLANRTPLSLNVDATKIRALVSLTEQITKPLGKAQQEFASLGSSISSSFAPVLQRVQNQVLLVNRAIEVTGRVSEGNFAIVARSAERAAQAISRLREVQALTARGPRGTELAFTAPRVRDSLMASAAARQRAAESPAAALADGQVGRTVQQLTRVEALIAKAQSQVEARSVLNIDTTTAQQRLDNLISTAEALRGRIDTAIQDPRTNQQRSTDNEIALLQRREQAAKQSETQRSAIAQRAIDNEIALLQRREQAAKAAEDQRLAAIRRTEDNEIASLQRREQAAKAAEDQRQAIQQRAADNEIALLQRREQAAKAAEDQRLAGQQRAVENEIALLVRREQAARDAERGRLNETRVSPLDIPANLERSARARMGGDIPGGAGPLGAQLEVGRQVDNVTSRIGNLRQQIDSLPDGLRTAFIPALQRATEQAATLARAGFGATADQIRRAAVEAERLEGNVSRAVVAQNFGEQFGGQGRRGLEFGLQEVSLRSYTGQLQVLQRALSGAASEARGPALNAFNQLRTAISQAAARGTLDTRATREEIARLTDEATRAAAAAAGISPGRLGRAVQRAGDIGRNSFANLGLGIQQAVFAVEDFFSVTGGLDQRIRAAGNNISQLGFILGGTTGLIAGVSAAIVGQLIAAYIRWQNEGVGTEDRVKSLNDSLSRQESRVQSLADAFSSLADEIGRIGFSKPGADAAEFSKQLDEIRKKQAEFNVEQAAAVDPEVQRQRGIIAARQRELQSSQDPGDRVRLGRDIQQARRAEQEALDRLRSAPPISAIQAAQVAVESRRQVDVQAARESESVVAEQEANQRARQALADAEGRIRGARTGAERNRIAIDQLTFERSRLEQEIEANNFFGASLLAGGDNTVRRQQLAAVEAAIISLESGAVKAANALEIEVAKAARNAAEQIGRAQDLVARAIEAGVPGANGLQAQLDALVERLQKAQDDLTEAQRRARESMSGGDLAAAEEAKRQVASIQAEIAARDEEVRALDASRAAIERFDAALERVSEEADSNFQAARQRADEARANDLERGTARTAEERRRAEQDVQRSQGLRNRVDEEVAVARDRARRDPAVVENERRIAEIDRQLQSEGVLAEGRREELIRERERLRAQNESTVQQRVDADPGVTAARDASTQEERRQQQRARGREAMRSPAERAGIELGQTLQDISAQFQSLPLGEQLRRRDELNSANRRAIDDAMRQTAPAMLNMADEVQNAVLQGPSRAALQVSDVSTTQGAAELNRLLRGDDSARNQNLVELQKQSQALQELVTIARENGAPPGIFDN